MVQTHYVAAEKPYQVITAGGEIGMQIGTLIVVRESDGGIETKSHPVVSSFNKKIGMPEKMGVCLPEATVWNNVTEDETVYLCESGNSLLCDDFFYLVMMESRRRMSIGTPERNTAMEIFYNLMSYGVSIESLYPPIDDVKILLNIGEDTISAPGYPKNKMKVCRASVSGMMYRIDDDDEQSQWDGFSFTIEVPWGTIDEMYEKLFRKIDTYKQIFAKMTPAMHVTFIFGSDHHSSKECEKIAAKLKKSSISKK